VSAYETGAWSDFAVAVAGVGGVLAGLVFVAVSVNLESILQGQRLAGRAAHSLIMFFAPVLTSIFLLIPDQSRATLGIELIVTGAVLAPVLAVLNRPWGRPPEWTLGSWFLGNAVPSALLVISIIVAGIGLITETSGGLYWLPVGIIAALIGALVNTWVLLVEVRR
jgi:modulator of FtsH protease